MTNNKTGKKKKKFLIILIITAAVVFVLSGVGERFWVKKQAEIYMSMIKQGASDETLDEIIEQIVYSMTDNETIVDLITSNISGEDLNDIYDILIRNMAYKITALKKVDRDHYLLNLRISNYNNVDVAVAIAPSFALKAAGNAILGFIGQGNAVDKSQLFASMFVDKAEEFHVRKGSDVIFTRDYTIVMEKTGLLWAPSFENDNDMIFFVCTCAGIPVGAGPELTDGSYVTVDEGDEMSSIWLYIVVIVILVAVVAAIIWKKLKAKEDENTQQMEAVPINEQTIGITQAVDNTSYITKKTAVLYALSDQHNGMPFAVHQEPVFIGRDPNVCKITFKEGTAGVSSKHCSVAIDEASGDFLVTDMKSTYGTYLMNGQRLEPFVPYHLRSGDSFYVGDTRNSFRVELN